MSPKRCKLWKEKVMKAAIISLEQSHGIATCFQFFIVPKYTLKDKVNNKEEGVLPFELELSLRKPQSTSMARIGGFNQENVIKFFDIYEPLMSIVKNSPNRLYNCDETDLTVIQHKGNKLVSLKETEKQSQVSSDSEDEELDEPVYISIDNGDSENYAECPYCNVKFSFDKRGEKWIVCTKCGIWCHEECSGDDDYKNCIGLLFG
ncbi:hypothetical protein ANN_10817, partial [Periplaneta americana]